MSARGKRVSSVHGLSLCEAIHARMDGPITTHTYIDSIGYTL